MSKISEVSRLRRKHGVRVNTTSEYRLYAELTDDIFRYYSVPKNSLLKHKTSLSEPLSEAIKPTIVAIPTAFPMSSILPLA